MFKKIQEMIKDFDHKSDGFLFNRFIWQLEGERILPIEGTETIACADDSENLRFFSKTKDGTIHMSGCCDEDTISIADLKKISQMETAINPIGEILIEE